MPSKRKRLQTAIVKDILADIDRDIINDLKSLMPAPPAPDDILGIVLFTIHQELSTKLPTGHGVVLQSRTLTIGGMGEVGATIIISAEADWLQVHYKGKIRNFDYNQPELLPQVLTWVKKKLRAIRRSRHSKRRTASKEAKGRPLRSKYGKTNRPR